MSHEIRTEDEALQDDLYEACRQYQLDRWTDLSPDARRILNVVPEGHELLRLRWQRDYYRDRLLEMLRKERE